MAWGDHRAELEELTLIVAAVANKGVCLPQPEATAGTHTRRVELFIASSCNLDCSFCCEAERIAKKSLMPWEEMVEKLEAAARAGTGVIQFMGGEPTLHPRFADGLRLARDLGMRTYVITNLLRWDDERFAAEVGPLLDEAMVSLHAVGQERGFAVTGRRSWWERFERASKSFRAHHRGRTQGATVLSRFNVDQLDAIADRMLELSPTSWTLGNAVPVRAARLEASETNLSLSEQIALVPKLRELSTRSKARGCRLVFFCVPHCVLGPELWDDSHDLVIDGQDLSDDAQGKVNFWSEADYHTRPAPVLLARERTEACQGCARRKHCGGYFSDYFRAHGHGELRPVPEP